MSFFTKKSNSAPVPPSIGNAEPDNSVLISFIEKLLEGDFLSNLDRSDPLAVSLNKLINKLRQNLLQDIDRAVNVSIQSSEVAISAAYMLNDLRHVNGQVNTDELTDHHQCRLGKWYDACTEQQYKNHRAFRELETPHQQVHVHGKEAARLFNAGNIEAALEEIKQVDTASKEVLKKLSELDA